MSYRATPLTWCGFTLTQLLMGRQIHTKVPVVDSVFKLDWPYLETFREREKKCKERQKKDYDCRYRTRPLIHIPEDTPVRVNRNISGTVITPADMPRSYRIITPSEEIRRNRCDLNIDPQNHQPRQSKEIPPTKSPIMTCSRSGTSILPPTRFTYGKGDVV